MKHLFALFLLLLVTGTAAAQRFQVGQLTYAVTSAAQKTVAVTAYESTADDGDLVYIPMGSNQRSKAPAAGYDVEVPETVSYGGANYSVTAIADNAFMGLYLMQSISLPATLQSVGKTAFSGCTGLTKVVCLATTPPAAATNAFNRVDVADCTLQVPASATTAYKSAEVWRDFYFATQTSFTLAYYIDGVLYFSQTLLEGETITPIAEPTRENYIFTGWQGLPANLTMPAHNVTVTGEFKRGACATPTIDLRDGKIVFGSSTPGVVYHYTLGVKSESVQATSTVAEVTMPTVLLEVSVYTTAEGYTASQTATKAFDLSALATATTPGDVNGDNTVSIVDVAKLVDILLKK